MQNSSKWLLRGMLWLVALMIIFSLGHMIMGKKVVDRKIACLDQASSAGRATSPIDAVNKYAACMGLPVDNQPAVTVALGNTGNDTRPARCRYLGVWAATRGSMVYQVTLEADGKFVAVPARNAGDNAETITGAWSVAGKSIAWVYDSGAVWPPDVNAVTNETSDEFTLSEVNGSTTRYSLIEAFTPAVCAK